jgi:dipeptidyl-peptidase-4
VAVRALSRVLRPLATVWLLATPVLIAGQHAASLASTPAGDFIDRLFRAGEFSPTAAPAPRWLDGGASYALVESTTDGKTSVVKYDSATGAKREVLVTSAQLTPPGAGVPLHIDDLAWSSDAQRLLVFTNTHRVWRANTRGNYWLLDRRGHRAARESPD